MFAAGASHKPRHSEMELEGKHSGRPLHSPRFHLRRIGPTATKVGVADIMDFTKTTTLIGRNKSQVDFLLDSSNPVASQYISRLHARVIVQENLRCRLFNDSLNGIFINNTKMCAVLVELEWLTREIRSALSVTSPNIGRALGALRELEQLPVTPTLLMRVPAVLDTVKKCQKYKGSAEVRRLSRTIFTRFKAFILHMHSSKQS